jgi:hypothetical protein
MFFSSDRHREPSDPSFARRPPVDEIDRDNGGV